MENALPPLPTELNINGESRPERVRLQDLLAGPFDIKCFSLPALLVLALFYTIYFTRSLLLPIVLALLFSYLLAPVARTLRRWHVPQFLAAGIVSLGVLAILGTLISGLTGQASGWIAKAPYSLQKLEEKLSPLKKPIQRVTQAGAALEKIANTEAVDPKSKTVVEVKPTSTLITSLFSQTPDMLLSIVTVIILSYFLLAYDGLFLGKLIKTIPRFKDKKTAVSIAHEIEDNISKYLLTVSIINCCLGVAVGTAMFLLGMPNPVLWGAMAAALNFIPYLGASVGIIVMALAAVLSFDSLGWALVFPGAYLVLGIIEGNFVSPMILGRSFSLNPIVIIISLLFWGWMWGIIGALLAVPILAVFKIFCDHIEPLAPCGEFLSN